MAHSTALASLAGLANHGSEDLVGERVGLSRQDRRISSSFSRRGTSLAPRTATSTPKPRLWAGEGPLTVFGSRRSPTPRSDAESLWVYRDEPYRLGSRATAVVDLGLIAEVELGLEALQEEAGGGVLERQVPCSDAVDMGSCVRLVLRYWIGGPLRDLIDARGREGTLAIGNRLVAFRWPSRRVVHRLEVRGAPPGLEPGYLHSALTLAGYIVPGVGGAGLSRFGARSPSSTMRLLLEMDGGDQVPAAFELPFQGKCVLLKVFYIRTFSSVRRAKGWEEGVASLGASPSGSSGDSSGGSSGGSSSGSPSGSPSGSSSGSSSGSFD